MNRTALIVGIAAIGIVAIAGASGRIFYEPAPEPVDEPFVPIVTPPNSPAPTSTPNPLPEPPKPATCGGISNFITAEFDGAPLLGLPGTGKVQETINGGESFSLTTSANFEGGKIEKQIFINGLRLVRGAQTPKTENFQIIYKEYDRSTAPYTQNISFVPAVVAGTLDVLSVGAEPGEHVCGTFDVTGTGTHVIRVSGSFNQVVPPPRPGGQ